MHLLRLATATILAGLAVFDAVILVGPEGNRYNAWAMAIQGFLAVLLFTA